MMRYIFICAILLLVHTIGGSRVSIPSDNGYLHLQAESPELMAIFDQAAMTGKPSVMLPVGLTESIRNQGDISFEIRLKLFDVDGLPHLILAPGSGPPGSGSIYQSPLLYYGNATDRRVHFLFWDNSGPPAMSKQVNLVDGEWHMISAVLSFTSQPKYYAIYIDGVAATEGTRNVYNYSWVGPEPPQYHFIGGGGCKSGDSWPGFPIGVNECFFNGYIDEFRIWSKAITLADITSNLNSSLFGDEKGLAYALSFDEIRTDSFQEYFLGVNSSTDNSLLYRSLNNAYNQSVVFIPSNMTVETIFMDLNETHAQTTLVYINPSDTDEFHPYGRNNYFIINGTQRTLNMGQPQQFISNSRQEFTLVWVKFNGTTFQYKFGNLKALSMSATTYVPPITSNDPIAARAPLAAVDTPQVATSNDQTVAIAVGVTVPVVVVGVGAAVLAVLLIRRKKKAEKQKTFADKQGAIIQSRKVEIKNKIGSGSFGDVWKGIWRGKEVAIKEVKSGADSSFLNEIKIMAKLPPHENVMEVYGAIIDADSPSLVLEYCGGGSLDFLLYDSDVPISEEAMLKLALGIARGMEHLHKHNIVHRDLAARNVLLTTDHVPKICDFGMSRTVAERNASNKTKNDMGPIRWMAPEALEQEYSTKTDVWSYGIVLSEITSRREPHTDVDPLKIALQIRDEKMTPKIVDTCPPALADLMRMCWNPNPTERPEFSKIVELLELVVQKK